MVEAYYKQKQEYLQWDLQNIKGREETYYYAELC
jgi:hypothetical protein